MKMHVWKAAVRSLYGRARLASGDSPGRGGARCMVLDRERLVARLVPHALLGHALDAVSEGSLITDAAQRIVYANAAFTAVTGYSAEEVLGRNCRLLQGPGSDPATVAALRTTLAREETFRGEILNHRKDGTPFWNALTVSPLRDDTGAVTHFVSVQRDITAQKSMQDRLRFLVLHDPVTGLPNRTALDQHLSRLAGRNVRGAGQAAVGVIDLDDFKLVNDTFGHEAGDALLTEFGRRLRGKLRGTDFLARLGGDEFVLVIEDLDADTAKEQLGTILTSLHQAVDTEFVLGPTVSVPVEMSVGLALCLPGREDGNAVLRRADAALYHLKARKDVRSQWWHLDNTPAAGVPDGHGPQPVAAGPGTSVPGPTLSADDAQAYRHRLFTGGLRMFFQPVIDLQTGKIHFLEALARLTLEDGTIIPPDVFLPLLTDDGVDRLFQAGLEQILNQLAVWDSQGHGLRVSINLPPSVLRNPGCTRWVASTLNRHNIAPHRLVVELLENHVEDCDIQSRAFNDLLALGVGMAMDDLGAGHSSLRRLTALAFSTVKIDHRILAQLRTSPIPTLTFLTTMIQLAHDMGWDVIAEGLEDAGITEAASTLGIPYGQGYYLARPLPAESVPAWIADFTLPSRHPSFHTFPGALAYHWQLARLDSPHPGPLDACPLTSFLSTEPSAEAAMKWHEQQHSGDFDHRESASDLLNWLTKQITGNDHTDSAIPWLTMSSNSGPGRTVTSGPTCSIT